MQVLSSSPASVYSSMTDAFRRISSTEGTRRLWRGVASVILGAGPAHAVYFGSYELAKELAGGNEGGYSFLATGAFLFLPFFGGGKLTRNEGEQPEQEQQRQLLPTPS